MTAPRRRTTIAAALLAVACATASAAGCAAGPPQQTRLVGTVAGVVSTPLPRPAPRPVEGPGRIALSADGNQHDEDDWASSAMGLAILAQRDLQPNVVHYDYNDHVWDSNDKGPAAMRESVLGGGRRFGFDTSRFYDDIDPKQLKAGTANLTAEINASSADDELWLILAGPMETAWRAMKAARPDARKHVKCVSHGEWNNTHAATDHGGHSYDDLIDLGCREVRIPDQNGNLGKTSMTDWAFLQVGNPNLRWLYSRIDQLGNGDVSDAGMVLFVVTGDRAGTEPKLRSYFQG